MSEPLVTPSSSGVKIEHLRPEDLELMRGILEAWIQTRQTLDSKAVELMRSGVSEETTLTLHAAVFEYWKQAIAPRGVRTSRDNHLLSTGLKDWG